MSRLEHVATGRRVTLGESTLVGRSSSCAVTLADARSSSRHATLTYTGDGWVVRDLGSRNGTRVGDATLVTGGSARLSAGQVVVFANEVWRLLEDDPPIAAAEGPKGARRLGRDGLLALPDEDAPVVTVYAAFDGRWVAEQDGELRRVRDGHTVTLDGEVWRLELPPPGGGGTQATQQSAGGRSIETLSRMTLAVSRDEETVEVELDFFGSPLKLPPRSFGYLLVVLARAREADADEPASERGWLYAEDLCAAVGIDPERLNVEIYRCRKLLAELGVAGAAGLFERRAHTRQVRLGIECAEVVPL